MIPLRSLATACLAVGLAAGPASGETLMLAGPDDFSGSERLLTFETLVGSPGTVVAEFDGVQFGGAGGWPATLVNDSSPREFGPPGSLGVGNFERLPSPHPAVDMQLGQTAQRVAFEVRGVRAAGIVVTLMQGGMPVDVVEMMDLDPLLYRFVGLENADGFDGVHVQGVEPDGGAVALDNLRFEMLPEEPEPPAGPVVLACDGFEDPVTRVLKHKRFAPMQAYLRRWVAFFPVMLRDAWLVDEAGGVIIPWELPAPPMVRVSYSPFKSSQSYDVTSKVVAGGGVKMLPDDGWRVTLWRPSMSRPGVYDLSLESGAPELYVLDPACSERFVQKAHHYWWW